MSNPIIDQGIGLGLIFIFVSCILFGSVITQVYSYVTRFPKDCQWIKFFVLTVAIVDVLSTMNGCAWLYNVLVINWASPNIRSPAVFAGLHLGLNPLSCGLMGLLVHCFFVWRLHIITRSKILTAIVLLFTLCAAIGAIGTFVTAQLHIDFHHYDKLPLGPMWLIGSVLTDTLIAASLTYVLQKKKGDFQETNHLLDQVIRLTVQNGTITAVTALTDLILFKIHRSPTRPISFLMPQLYANTVLASLNARQLASGRHTHHWSSTIDSGEVSELTARSYKPRRTTLTSFSPGIRSIPAPAVLSLGVRDKMAGLSYNLDIENEQDIKHDLAGVRRAT